MYTYLWKDVALQSSKSTSRITDEIEKLTIEKTKQNYVHVQLLLRVAEIMEMFNFKKINKQNLIYILLFLPYISCGQKISDKKEASFVIVF